MEYIKSAVCQAITGIISTFVSPLISWLYSPMLVTLAGRAIHVRLALLQPKNAYSPICVTPLPMIMLWILLLDEYQGVLVVLKSVMAPVPEPE